MRKLIVILVLGALTDAVAGDTRMGLQSALVPGMGQLAAGRGKIQNGSTLKGLAIMAGFTVAVHGAFTATSRQESFAELTTTKKAEMEQANFFQDKEQIYDEWTQASENHESEKTRAFIFIGAAVAIYAYGIIDALLFTTQKTENSSKAYFSNSKTQVALTQKERRSGLAVQYRF